MIAPARPRSGPPTALAVILAALLLGGPALAKPPAAKQPTIGAPQPVPAEPGTTTASYGDWVLRCQRIGTVEKSARLCEVAQAMQVQGQAAPIAQIAIGRPPGQADLHVTALLPVAVSFPSTVQVALGDKETKSEATQVNEGGANEGKAGEKTGDARAAEKTGDLDLAWRRCLPGGCLAESPAPEAVLERWRAAEPAGRILFKDAGGREVAIPLSFRGLGPALDALAKEPS